MGEEGVRARRGRGRRCPYSCRVLKRRWQISRMAPSSLASCDTSRSSSPTASTSSSTDSKSAPPSCRIPAGTGRRRCTPLRSRARAIATDGCVSRRGRQVAPARSLPGRLSRQRGGVGTRGWAGGPEPRRRRALLTRHVSEDLAVQVRELAAEDVGAGRHGGAGAGPGRGAARCRRRRRREPGTAAEAEGTARARGPPGRRRAAAMRAGAAGKWSPGGARVRGGSCHVPEGWGWYRGQRGGGQRGPRPSLKEIW